MSRLRGAAKAPIAVAGILAAPLFFVALLAFSLKLDKPSHVHGTLGGPTKGTVGTIYLATVAVIGALVLAGVLSMLLRSRLTVIVPAGAGIVISILLLIPIGMWGSEHTKRYPLGIDNTPPKSPQDIWLRGEWEHNAQATAHQIGLVTIGIGVAVILISLALKWRGPRGYVVSDPPPTEGILAPTPNV